MKTMNKMIPRMTISGGGMVSLANSSEPLDPDDDDRHHTENQENF